MRTNFATGLIGGVLLASVLILAFSAAQGQSNLRPQSATGGIVLYTSEATATTTVSSTTTALVPAFTAGLGSNLTNSVQSTTSSVTNSVAESLSGLATASPARPASSLAVVASQPLQSLLLLLPIAFAVILGLAFYKTSAPED